MCVCVHVRLYYSVCMSARVCLCVSGCACACVCLHACVKVRTVEEDSHTLAGSIQGNNGQRVGIVASSSFVAVVYEKHGYANV